MSLWEMILFPHYIMILIRRSLFRNNQSDIKLFQTILVKSDDNKGVNKIREEIYVDPQP